MTSSRSDLAGLEGGGEVFRRKSRLTGRGSMAGVALETERVARVSASDRGLRRHGAHLRRSVIAGTDVIVHSGGELSGLQRRVDAGVCSSGQPWAGAAKIVNVRIGPLTGLRSTPV